MAARCASCRYPLSVSDSVSCCECLSYFHIDCAQLVGFPYYELSSDPVRNTFHCQTCKILPLPQSNSFCDSDSDDECIMPSRQLDYHSEGQPDFAINMNEIKGSVQDLSDLCKDMFREINELKSINLTLRCCVENLRHDGEQRDGIISELERRIKALEVKRDVFLFHPIDSTDMCIDRVGIEKEEDTERYLTPDPEYSRLKELESFDQECIEVDDILKEETIQNSILHNLKCKNLRRDNISESIRAEKQKPTESGVEMEDTDDTRIVKSYINEERISDRDYENVHFAEEDTISAISEENTQKDTTGLIKDWDWKGSKAIQLNEHHKECSEEDETSNIEDTDAQEWEILDEDVKSKFATKRYEDEASENAESTEESEEVADERRVTWAVEVENYDQTEGSSESEEERKTLIPQPNVVYLEENNQVKSESRSNEEEVYNEEKETEETSEGQIEADERTSLKEEERDTPKLDGYIEIGEGAEVEGRTSETGSRLEGGSVGEEGTVLEGEVREGGQSPEAQGEVQPFEFSEGSEPPPPPQPQHTPDDLWDYLKETVTGEHPATVEEFVQKLIGTLEHVPEEYLKPVIDYNIKRATSPSVTDGEHLEAKEGSHHLEGEEHGIEQIGSDDARPQVDGEIAPENTISLAEEDAPAMHDDTTNISQDPSESVEGYSALEATTWTG